MLRWFNFILGGLLALRLYSGTATPLQLTIKLADVHGDLDQAGIVLMESIDLKRCFDAVRFLLEVKTCRFREYTRNTCKTRFSLDNMKKYDPVTVNLHFAIAKYLGTDCFADIQAFGDRFPEQSLAGIPINSWTKMINLSKHHVEEIIMTLYGFGRKSDILFTGFLQFDKVIDPEIVTVLLRHYRTIFDGPFVEFNVNHAAVLVPSFLRLGFGTTSFDISELSSGEFSQAANSLIKDKIGTTHGSIDIISRLVQLASAFMYASNSCRCYMATGALLRIKSAVIALFDFVMVHHKSYGGRSREVRAAAYLARATVDNTLFMDGFNQLVLKSGKAKETGFYEMILDMTEPEVANEDVLSLGLVAMLVRMKIEILVLLSRFGAAPKKMYGFVATLVAKRLYRGARIKPPCRHLLVLLWALGDSKQVVYKDSCKLLLSYILHHMYSGTDVSTFKRMGVYRFAPRKVLQRMARPELSSDLRSGMLQATLVLGRPPGPQPAMTLSAPNGYLDVQEARRRVLSKILGIMQEHYVYCGHKDGIPVYIQSLGCHQALSSLLQVLIVEAAGLRLKLPFTFHPILVSKIVGPPETALDYLRVAATYEFGRALPRSVSNQKVTRVLALLEQTKDGMKEGGRECVSYGDWESRIPTFHRWTFRRKASLMRRWLKSLGEQMVKSNVMPLSFDGKFEAALITLPGLSKTLLKE